MKNKILHIYKKELRELFRDKKSLSMMVIIPLMIPLIIFGMSYLFNSEVNKKVDTYNKIGFTYSLTKEEKEIAKELKIKVVEGDLSTIKKKYREEKLDLYITKEGNKYTMNGTDNETSAYAITLMKEYFDVYKTYLQQISLESSQIDSNQILNIITVDQKLQKKDNYFASYIINYAFLFIIMAITVSSTYPATDATAGEKERGTLETLLTFPIKGRDIILGKYFSVATSSLITGILSLILTCICLFFVGDLFEIYEGIDLTLSIPTIIFSSFCIIFYSLLVSGLSIAIASRAKTFKEAQSSLTPLTFITFFPSMIAFLVNLKTTTLLSLVPFLNYTLLFNDITTGSVEIIHLLLMALSTVLFLVIILTIIIKQYKSEKILFQK